MDDGKNFEIGERVARDLPKARGMKAHTSYGTVARIEPLGVAWDERQRSAKPGAPVIFPARASDIRRTRQGEES